MTFYPALRTPLRIALAKPTLTRLPRPTTFSKTYQNTFSTSPFRMADKGTPGTVHFLDTKEEYVKYIVESKGPVVLDAYAEWCGPCKMIAPHVEKMSANYEGAKFYKFDVDKLPDVAQELAIRAMPTFIIYNDGEESQKIVGANIKAIEAAITGLGVTAKAA